MSDAWWHIDLKRFGFLTVLSVVLMVVTSVTAVAILIRLPADYFVSERHLFPSTGSPIVRWVTLALKNLLGLATVIVGIVLSLPGVPGPGLLVIFIGLLLADFPGKYRLERRIIGIAQVADGLDRIRTRFKKPPFERPPVNPTAT